MRSEQQVEAALKSYEDVDSWKTIIFRITPKAAELIGNVRIIPIKTETTIPIRNGCCSVPQLIKEPSQFIKEEIGGPTNNPTTPPTPMQINGVRIISSFVLPVTKIPISIAT